MIVKNKRAPIGANKKKYATSMVLYAQPDLTYINLTCPNLP